MNHDFRLLWIGQTVSELGTRVSMFVFPLVAYALTGSATLAALTESAHLLGMALVMLPAGALADRLHRLRVMRGSAAAGVLLYASLVAAVLAGSLTLPHLLAVAFGTGLAAGVFAPAEISAIRTVVPPAELPTALAQSQARQHVASLAGGPLGGLLYGLARSLPFAFDAVSYAVSWVLLGRIRTSLAPSPTARRRRLRSELAEGAAYVVREPLLRVLLVWAPLLNLTINALSLVAVLRLITAGYSPVAIGLVETASGVCGILGAVVAPRVVARMPTGWLTIAVGWSWVPLAVPMLFVNHPVAAAISLSFGVFLNPVGNTGMASYRLTVTPPELVGRVQSVVQFGSYLTLPVFPVVAGVALAHLGGPGAVGLLIGLTALVALIPTLSSVVRAVPRPADWVAAGAPAGPRGNPPAGRGNCHLPAEMSAGK